MEKIRFALVGAGRRGRELFRLAMSASEHVIPVAACDINPDFWHKPQRGQRALAEAFPETNFYEDFKTMLDSEQIDALLVETPAHIHTDFCAEGLRRNINVLSDIPLVRTYEEAEMLWEVGKKSTAKLMTGANPNEWGFVAAMEDLYEQGLLGNPFLMEAEYIHDVRHLWVETPWRSKGGQPIKYCTHSLGPLLRLLRNDELRKVSCFTTGSHIVGKPGYNDAMCAHFVSEKNVVVRLLISFINEAKCGNHSYRVFGTEGYFERLAERGNSPAHTMFNSKKLYCAGKLTELPIDMPRPEFVNAANAGHGGADFVILHNFLEAVHTGDWSKTISMKDGLRMTLPGIFAGESADKGGALVDLRYPWDND